MKIIRFEELEIWKSGRELNKRVFEITSAEPFCKDYRFRDQIRSSSGSIPDNIAEGFDRGGNKEFIHFLSIARGSCGEVRSQLYRAYDIKYIDSETFEYMLKRTAGISSKIINLIKHLRSTDHMGIKYD